MPTISMFFGFVVQMYWRDHPPPHVHVFYQGFEALVAIESGEIMRARCRCGALRVVKPWIERRRPELRANWERGRLRQPFERVPGAETLGEHRLWLRFSDGREGVRDFADILAEAAPWLSLCMTRRSSRGSLSNTACPTWPNGFDVDAVALHQEMEAAGLLSATAAA